MRMRHLVLSSMLLLVGCAPATLYVRYAGPAQGSADEAFACVQGQMKELGYHRAQFNSSTRWVVGEKIMRYQNASGLYIHTVETLDTKVDVSPQGVVNLDVKARTLDKFATVKSDDLQERKADDRVQLDARALGRACASA